MGLVIQSYFILKFHPHCLEFLLQDENILHFGLHMLLFGWDFFTVGVAEVSLSMEHCVCKELVNEGLVILHLLFIFMYLQLGKVKVIVDS